MNCNSILLVFVGLDRLRVRIHGLFQGFPQSQSQRLKVEQGYSCRSSAYN